MGGGVMNDYGVYAIAFVSAFLCNFDDVSSFYRNSLYGIDSDWMIRISYGQAQAFINISSDFSSSSKSAIIGDKATIEWESQFNRTNIIRLFDKSGILLDQFVCKYRYDGYEFEIDEVHKCIRESKLQSEVVPLSYSLLYRNMISRIQEVSISTKK